MNYPDTIILHKNDRGNQIPFAVLQRIAMLGGCAVGSRGFDHMPQTESRAITLVFVHSRGKRHTVKASVQWDTKHLCEHREDPSLECLTTGIYSEHCFARIAQFEPFELK